MNEEVTAIGQTIIISALPVCKSNKRHSLCYLRLQNLRTRAELRANVKTAVEVKCDGKLQLDKDIYLISKYCLKTASSDPT